ncbi:MAG TPA: FtsX-like permease family protein [Ktedonobacteraceae bacterium]
MKISMYFNYTIRSLWRGGQRTLLAIFCVAVGVMAIVALQLVGLMINNAFNNNVRDANGGDIAVRSQNQPFTQDDLSFFNQLKKNGTIHNYTAVINAQGSTGTNTKSSLRQSFDVRVIDPKNYPVVTPPTFTNPANGKLADLVKNQQIVVTQPFIDQYKKKIGNSFDMHIGSRTQGSFTVHVKLVGIVAESGILAQSGSVVLFSINDYKAAHPTTSQENGATQSQNATAPQQNGTLPSQNSTVPQQSGTTSQPNGTATGQSGSGAQQASSAPAKQEVLYDSINIVTDSAHINQAVKKIQDHFPIANTQTATDALKQQQDTIDNIRKFLEIAGLLALLIGGVGIVNTMQVLLSRRKIEIAMLKTTGYRRFDLYLLFGLEAGLLGLVGGVIGAGAATGVSYLVRNVVQSSFGLTIPFQLDWFTIGEGVMIGLATALIFGLLPIVQAANIRPLNVIREMPERWGAGSIFLTLGLLLLLTVLFCTLAIVILNNDIVLGVTSVYSTFIFLGLLSLFFGLVIFLMSKLPVPEHLTIGSIVLVLVMVAVSLLIMRVLPAFGMLLLIFPLLGIIVMLAPRTWKANAKMALRNLNRQRARTTTTLLALFVGIFTIGLILILGQNLHEQVNSAIANMLSYNAFTVTSNDDTTKLQNKIKSVPGLQAYQRHTLASTAPVAINDKPIQDLLPTGDNAQPSPGSLGRGGALYFLSGIEGYDVGKKQLPTSDTLSIVKGRNLQSTDAGTDNVLIANQLADMGPLHLKVGDMVMLSSIDSANTRLVHIVGIYSLIGFGSGLYPVLGTSNTATALAPADVNQAVFYMKISPDKLSSAVDTLGRIVPNAFTLNLANISDIIDQMLNDILLTLTTIASLSLIAGVIIIANAVALAMLERRRELGILKSVGYTSQNILGEVLLENGLVGGTGAMMAMLLVSLVIFLLGRFVFKAVSLAVAPSTAIAMVVGAILLAMLTAALVAWQAVRVRPLEVLRYE